MSKTTVIKATASAPLLVAVALAGLPRAASAQDAATATPPQTEEAARIGKARGAIKGLAEALKGHLVGALKEKGPVGALAVCNEKAMPVTREQAAAAGVRIGRTALKVRNPDNAPDAFETRALQAFAEKLKGGADIAKLEHAEVVTENGVKTFRYLKPIPMAAEPCAACHGSEIKDDVKAAIAKLYPKDQAVGFEAGQLRGAFTVSEILK